MKIASYNLENLFLRPVVMNQDSLAPGKVVLQAHAELNAILGKTSYSATDKTRIVALLKRLGLDKKDDGGPFALLRQNRGHLLKRPRSGGIEVVADGRGDWIGWVELKREEVNEVATVNTARVINDVDADILGVIEAESRPALIRFSQNVLGKTLGGRTYDHAMLIDGKPGTLRHAATLRDPGTGIVMDVSTTQPAIQLYSDNVGNRATTGKGGKSYGNHYSMSLETEGYLDASNHPNFPSSEVTPARPYHEITVFGFSRN